MSENDAKYGNSSNRTSEGPGVSENKSELETFLMRNEIPNS